MYLSRAPEVGNSESLFTVASNFTSKSGAAFCLNKDMPLSAF